MDRELGFVIAPEGKSSQEYHISDAYLKNAIKKGETSMSKIVTFKKGVYEYFCPLNPTSFYKLIVE